MSKISWRIDSSSRTSVWKPNALRVLPLAFVITTSWTLIAVLQILLVKSQKEGGIIIANTFDDISSESSFLYRYLPTIVALVFSILWSWIDLQVKRLEPYHQMSKPDGAWGRDSLLLSYPFDFLPFIPFSAARRKHWAVFFASTSIMLVTWGIVPVQAGIFSSETIHLSSEAMFEQTMGYIPASEQSETLDGQYIYSAHSIIWLNETLPPYMTRDYALAPFQPQEATERPSKDHQTWTSPTTLYSLDMSCEIPAIKVQDELQMSSGFEWGPKITQSSQWISSDGCGYPTDYYSQIINQTVGPNPEMDNMTVFDIKKYGSIYIGQYSTESSNYYLETYCPKTANHTFMAWFFRNRQHADDRSNKITRLYCTPSYYEQDVVATIDANTRAPLNYTVASTKRNLPAEKWNSTFFETHMNTGKINEFNRGRSLPLYTWPDQLETLSAYPVSLGNYGTILSPMAGYAVGTSQGPLEDLLEPSVLAAAYQSVYRIVFARSMLEILDHDFASTLNETGKYDYDVAAIVVVPAFTYIVEGLLGVVSLCGIALMMISVRRDWSLRSDPATLASIASLVADNGSLLQELSMLSAASMDEIEASLKDKKFKLEFDGHAIVIVESDNFDPSSNNAHGTVMLQSEESQAAKHVRPKEFRSFMVIPFVLLQVALAVTLGVLFHKNQPLGLPRPSANPVLRQILENYIPTALATLIEPVWILVNRLLCTLQPLEELRGGRAVAKRSIEADYSSLPPQLVIFKALRCSHFKLAVVCAMALLANLLAVAFSGMFDERPVGVPQTLQLAPPYEAKFVAVNGSVSPGMEFKDRLQTTPSGAFMGGAGINQFMVADSNYTAGNALPAWTDNDFMYVPFMNETNYTGGGAVKSRTMAFGSILECKTIPDTDYTVALLSDITESLTDISITMLDDSTGNRVTCSAQHQVQRGPAPVSGTLPVCDSGRLAIEFVLRIDAPTNATREERDFCQQTAFLGYARVENDWCIPRNKKSTRRLDDSTAMFVGCRPQLVAGEVNVRVSASGRVEEVTDLNVSTSLSPDFYNEHFSNGTSGAATAGGANDLMAQAQGYIFQFVGARYHNDSFATDFLNYFLIKQSNDSRLLDPNTAPPTLQDITEKLYPVYRKLFAIWLGINKNKLLVPRSNSLEEVIDGQTNEIQIRIFVSKPLFIMAEIILTIYAIAAVCVYLWRPGKFLPRMPTSIGAIIPLFAGSKAVEDLCGTSLFTKRQRRDHLDKLGDMYGYGTFMSADGTPHEGIEKEPLVNAVPLLGVREKIQTGFSSQKGLAFRRDKGN